ncbi:efflux RND transporter periplasmic adaptor subunit [bacterium]|nr:efflux RND transporter periplasmic adaptor subunit [bacterium]
MKKAFIIIIVLVVLIAIVAFIGIAIKKRSSTGIEVQTEMAIRRNIAQVVTAFGRLSPEVEIDISTKVIGEIKKIYVDEGDTVIMGDTLVRLERNRYIASFNSAKASLSSARAQVERVQVNLNQSKETLRKTRSMSDKGLVSEDALARAETQVKLLEAELGSTRDGVERAKAMLDEAQDNLDQTIVLAPVSGVVVELYAEAGENVITGTTNVPGSSIMTIAQLDAMEAVVSVDEADVVDLEIGQTARVEVDAFPDTFLTGVVAKIANRANLQNIGGQETVANFVVKVAVENGLDKIRPGMSCSAEIEVARADSVIAVPIQAVVAAREIQSDDSKGINNDRTKAESDQKGMGEFNKSREAVFVVEKGVAKQKIVKTAIADDRYIEITEGLEGDEKVVIGRYKALRELKDGDKVREIGGEKGKGSWNVKFD